jgi:hypothetical protein
VWAKACRDGETLWAIGTPDIAPSFEFFPDSAAGLNAVSRPAGSSVKRAGRQLFNYGWTIFRSRSITAGLAE